MCGCIAQGFPEMCTDIIRMYNLELYVAEGHAALVGISSLI